LLIARFMGTIVPGRALTTTAPADRAIHPADQPLGSNGMEGIAVT
jgi:hypothetical protein